MNFLSFTTNRCIEIFYFLLEDAAALTPKIKRHYFEKILFWSFFEQKGPKIDSALGFLSFMGNQSMTCF